MVRYALKMEWKEPNVKTIRSTIMTSQNQKVKVIMIKLQMKTSDTISIKANEQLKLNGKDRVKLRQIWKATDTNKFRFHLVDALLFAMSFLFWSFLLSILRSIQKMQVAKASTKSSISNLMALTWENGKRKIFTNPNTSQRLVPHSPTLT